MSRISGIIAFQQTVTYQWKYQQKMERHFSVETKLPIESQRSTGVSTEIVIAVQQIRTENENFWGWKVSVGQKNEK